MRQTTDNRDSPPITQELADRVRSLSPAQLALLEGRLASRQTSNGGSAERALPPVVTPDKAVSILDRLDELTDSEVEGLLEQITPQVFAESQPPTPSPHNSFGITRLLDDASELFSRLDDLAEGEVDRLLKQLMQNDE